MPRLNAKALAFLASYDKKAAEFGTAALELEGHLKAMLADLNVPLHAVQARAKTPVSLRGKLRRKAYSNPAAQVTDLVAVRVITYFGRDLDRVERQLHGGLDVSESKSRDARKELQEDQFGYRSVHLVARVHPKAALTLPHLRRRWFEVQIRSILDHAWSEIEHEAVYKSGVDFPPTTRRKFKALAASLEVLEDAFAALDAERDKMTTSYRTEYAVGVGLDRRFDVARLLAFLEATRPGGRGWRQAEASGQPFLHGSAAAAIELLREARIDTAERLTSVLSARAFREAAYRFAAVEGVAVDAISHLGIVVLAVGAIKARLLEQQFPEMLFSRSVVTALASQ